MQFVFPYACIAFWGYWFAPCGPFSFVPGALYTSSFRHKTRKQFGITSSGQCIPGYSNDVFVHLFFFPFALCQEHVELKKNTPFVPLRRLYDDAGERVATGIMDKKKSRKWTFNLDEISDDEDDEGACGASRGASQTGHHSPAEFHGGDDKGCGRREASRGVQAERHLDRRLVRAVRFGSVS